METMVSAPFVVSRTSLPQAFAEIPDSRRAGSVRHTLPAILMLAVSALLAHHHSVLAMVEWGACQPPAQRRALGFLDGTTPCQSSLQHLNAPADDQALQGVAIDGKAQRGSFRFAADGPVHVLGAFCHETGMVLAQVPISVTTTEAGLTGPRCCSNRSIGTDGS